MKAGGIRREPSEILRRGGEKGRRELAAELKAEASDATLKRVLRGMISEGVIEGIGQGRAARYRSSVVDRVLGEVDVDAYFSAEIDERKICGHVNFQLIQDELPQVVDRIFSASELAEMREAEEQFRDRYGELSEAE